MLIDVNKWIDKNGSFDEAGGLDLVRHGYEWIRRMRKFENKADRHTFQNLMRQCYDNFFKSWHEEYEHWADDEDAIREELHHNQYEGQLYYENGEAHAGPLNKIE